MTGAFSTLKIIAFAQIARARVRTAMMVKAGDFPARGQASVHLEEGPQ